MLQRLNKMAAGDRLFCLVRRPRSYQRRPILGDMADCEVVERFRLSRARIEWLVNELGDELRRNTARSCPLAPEANVNTSVVLLLLLLVLFQIMFENRLGCLHMSAIST